MLLGVVIAPTVLALAWYALSKDPNLRPLGITREALQTYAGTGPGVEIVATIEGMAPGMDAAAQTRLKQSIRESFRAKGVEVRIETRDGSSGARVTYTVGKTQLGPYPTSRASEGIEEAVEAFRMHGSPVD
jgi:hypothetical protein